MTTPSVFLGHGSPENALQDNSFTRHLTQWGARLPTPKLVVVVSAHWESEGIALGLPGNSPLLYDFYGFPPELYALTYPCPSPDPQDSLVREVARRCQAPMVSRALDHGAWAVLRFLLPGAQIPVCQLSLNRFWSPEEHLALALRLGPLRQEGVLFLGSGNLVHNLALADFDAMERPPFPWALRADLLLKDRLEQRDLTSLAAYSSLGEDVSRGIPTDEHFLPALYALGWAEEPPVFIHEGIQNGSVSMRCFLCGASLP